MNRYTIITIIFFLLYLKFLDIACGQVAAKQLHKIVSNHKVLNYTGNIVGVLDIARDSVIVIKDLQLLLTVNGGTTWADISNHSVYRYVTVDNHNCLWAMESGGQLYKPKYQIFFKSSDFGKRWSVVKFNTDKLWITRIISKPRCRLEILNSDNKIYELSGNNFQTCWKYIRSETNTKANSREYLPPYFIGNTDNGKMKLYKTIKGKNIKIAQLDSLYQVRKMIKVGPVLYVAGDGLPLNGFSTAYIAAIVNEKSVISYKLPGAFADLVKGLNNRIWAFNGKNLYLLKNKNFVKYY